MTGTEGKYQVLTHGRQLAATVAMLALAVVAPSAIALAVGDRDTEVAPTSTAQALAEPQPVASVAGDEERPVPGIEPGDAGPTAGSPAASVAPAAREPQRLPSRGAVGKAKRWVDKRQGNVAFAVVDSRGRLSGLRGSQTFSSASVVKAMLLIAEIDRLKAAELPLDADTRSLLTAMITVSDNEAADAIYGRFGDDGLNAVATEVGMSNYSVAGHWGNSQISAGDMALLMSRLGSLTKGRYGKFARRQLASIVPEQSWGVAAVVDERWRIWFKGGWLPESSMGVIVHQAARLSRGPHTVSIAVLTAGNPSHEYGVETIEGVSRILLEDTGPRR